MAGISVLQEDVKDWYKCSDGSFIEPLDALFLLFPNQGRRVVKDNVCFVSKPFVLPYVDELLPVETESFSPAHAADGVCVLTMMCLMVFFGIILTHNLWNKLGCNFAAVTPAHKKWYVVANLSKSLILAILCIGTTRFWVVTYNSLFLDKFLNLELKRCSLVYAATDVVALFLVPKLPRSTIIHHVVTAFLCLGCTGINLSQHGWEGILGVGKMVMLYGLFSSISFPVNAYLALRVVYPKKQWLYTLCNLSFWLYILCCAINWSAHGYWLLWLFSHGEFSVYAFLYCFLIAAMVNDDITLMKWLNKKGTPIEPDAKEK